MARKELIESLLSDIDGLEQDFYAGLSDQERTEPGSPERWSVRDLQAHLAAWKERLADNLVAAKSGHPPVLTTDYDHENAILYKLHKDKTWEQVAEYAQAASRKLSREVASLSETQLASSDYLPYPNGRPLWRTVASYCYSHPMIHLAEHYREKGDMQRAGELVGGMSRAMAGLDDSQEWQGVTKYNLACQYALLGATELAIDELRQALELNPSLIEWSKEDSDLDSIRESPTYLGVYERLQSGGEG